MLVLCFKTSVDAHCSTYGIKIKFGIGAFDRWRLIQLTVKSPFL